MGSPETINYKYCHLPPGLYRHSSTIASFGVSNFVFWGEASNAFVSPHISHITNRSSKSGLFRVCRPVGRIIKNNHRKQTHLPCRAFHMAINLPPPHQLHKDPLWASTEGGCVGRPCVTFWPISFIFPYGGVLERLQVTKRLAAQGGQTTRERRVAGSLYRPGADARYGANRTQPLTEGGSGLV